MTAPCTCPPMHLCERHGLVGREGESATAEPKRKRGLRPESDKQKTLGQRWAFIRSCFLICQLRSDGYYSCHSCGARFDSTKDLDLDHIVSRGRGGDYTPSNAQLLCRVCHSEKHGVPMWSSAS